MFKLYLEIIDIVEEYHPDWYQHKVQKPAAVLKWVHVSPMAWVMHICKGIINAER